MATSYPNGIDDFAAVAGTDATSKVVGSRTHSQLHNDTGDAVEYSEGGALKWRGSSGTITTLAAP